MRVLGLFWWDDSGGDTGEGIWKVVTKEAGATGVSYFGGACIESKKAWRPGRFMDGFATPPAGPRPLRYYSFQLDSCWAQLG